MENNAKYALPGAIVRTLGAAASEAIQYFNSLQVPVEDICEKAVYACKDACYREIADILLSEILSHKKPWQKFNAEEAVMYLRFLVPICQQMAHCRSRGTEYCGIYDFLCREKNKEYEFPWIWVCDFKKLIG